MTFTMKQSIIITLITVLILLVILLTGLIFILIEKRDDFRRNITTNPWIESGNVNLNKTNIKANMNKSADYCDDFHNYACGGYVKSTSIPDDKRHVSILSALVDKVIKQLNTLIDRPSQPDELKVFKIAKHLYKICMDTEAMEEQGLQPFFNYLEQLGGWPVLKKDNEWNETLFNWNENFAYVAKKPYWLNPFFKLNLDFESKKNERQVVALSGYSSGLPRENLSRGLNDESVSNYFNYMVDISVELGAKQQHAKKELKEALDFEIKLANLGKNRSTSHKSMSLGDLEKKYPYFQWKNYLNYNLTYANVSVDDGEMITLINPDYFDQLGKLMATTPKKIQANLVIWKEIENSAKYMNEKIRKLYENYVELTNGIIRRKLKWIECTDTVLSYFRIAISALYVREYFQKDSKGHVEIMVKNIHNQFIKLINNTNWIDNETMSKALHKAEKMKHLVAYPDELLNNTKINDYYKVYEDFKMVDDNYIGSMMSLNYFDFKIKWSQLRQIDNPNKWDSFANESSQATASYHILDNSIEIPAAILQGEVFNNDLPKYMNYGAIGAIVGHEIMHAFDNVGKKYDANGNKVDWWTYSTNEKYKKKAQCIIDQYGNYTVKEINKNVNGIKTQAENIADNGGIKAAYWAYVNWSNDNKNNGNNEIEKMLPGFNLTPRQMFWISYANTMCSKSHPGYQELIILDDEHSPTEFRINGPLSNSEDFSKDFGCPKGSRMNPEKKCTMW